MSHHSKKFKEVDSINNSKKYHCPRCGTELIKDYGRSFDCPICESEFEKADCDRHEDDDSAILSIDCLKESVTELYIIRGTNDNPRYFSGSYKLFSNIHFLKDNTIIEIEDIE